ncbi:Vacuolar protein sorting-associated protein 53 [Terramyces sp. JEL0728]|nr:Vacuolar protein sorting-associated protein 53 [Terramyces sp. JEL0728]
MNIKIPPTPTLNTPSAIALFTPLENSESPTSIFEQKSHEEITISSELKQRISSVLATESQDFQIIPTLNELFPNEESLEKADEILEKTRGSIKRLDSALHNLIQQHSKEKNTKIIKRIQTDINELVKRTEEIKKKSRVCESVIVEITRDIKALDETKKNLGVSTRILKRIYYAVNALEQLKQFATNKQYDRVAELMAVTLKLMEPLKPMKDVAQIVALCERSKAFQQETRKAIFTEFEQVFASGLFSNSAQLLFDSCLVLETLEDDAKGGLIKWYTDLQLADYRNLFKKNPELAGLSDVSRRYSWLKRFLKTFDEQHAQLFPEPWKVDDAVTLQFCLETKKDLAAIMTKSEHDSTFDTMAMLQAIHTTVDFEGKLDMRFCKHQEVHKYAHVLTSSFDSFLWHYIDMEDHNLSEKFEPLKLALGEMEEGIYSSSVDLFLSYRQTFGTCAKLSIKKPFFDLCKMYQKWLNKYKDCLCAKLPKDDRKLLSEDELVNLCAIINTSDYCTATTTQLEEKLIETIDTDFKTLVSFATESEAFATTTATALLVLVKTVENYFGNALNILSKKNWSALSSVGDQSEHVTLIAQVLSQNIPIIRRSLTNQKHFRSFCDKFVETFLNSIQTTILTRCRPMSEVGAEQMLLDTHSINSILVAMTMLGIEEKTQPPASFTKILARGIARIDNLLKVALRPIDPPEAIVETYFLLFTDPNVNELQKILELKGLKRTDMNTILDFFVQKAPPSAKIKLEPEQPSKFRLNFSNFINK